jgi:enolase
VVLAGEPLFLPERLPGKHEALELRDKDPKRYLGKGAQKAVQNIGRVFVPSVLSFQVLDTPNIKLEN